jgi:hypothetical protein
MVTTRATGRCSPWLIDHGNGATDRCHPSVDGRRPRTDATGYVVLAPLCQRMAARLHQLLPLAPCEREPVNNERDQENQSSHIASLCGHGNHHARRVKSNAPWKMLKSARCTWCPNSDGRLGVDLDPARAESSRRRRCGRLRQLELQSTGRSDDLVASSICVNAPPTRPGVVFDPAAIACFGSTETPAERPDAYGRRRCSTVPSPRHCNLHLKPVRTVTISARNP